MTACTLSELLRRGALFYSDGYRTKQSELGASGLPILRVSQVGRGHLRRTQDVEFVRTEFRPKMGLKVAKHGDIVVTTKGTVGRTARVTPEFEGFVYSPQVCFVRVGEQADLDSDFLYYWFQSPDFVDQISAIKTQTDMADYVNLRDFGAVAVQLPPIDVQRAAGTTLSLLDSKTLLNRGMNEALESLERTIFRSWFVDFDPVRAKAEGRERVGIDRETAALFPDSFEESPLGPVPSGWKAVRLGSQIDVIRGLSYSGAALTDADGGGLPLHNLNSIRAGGGYQPDGLKWFAGDYANRHVVSPGDVIVANTDLTWAYEVIGSPAIVPRRYGETELFSADLFRLDIQRQSPLTERYIYFLLSTRRYHDEVAGYANGTTVNHLPTAALQRPWIVLPPRPIIERFEAIVGPMLDLQELLNVQSEALEATRNTLLPKLISGEIRVPVAG